MAPVNARCLSSPCQPSRSTEVPCCEVFLVPILSGYGNGDGVRPHRESLQGLSLAFSQVRIYTAPVFTLSLFLSLHFPVSHFRIFFFLLVTLPFRCSNTVLKNEAKYSLSI